MIRRIVPGIAVFGLVAGLSGMLAGHIWNRYSQQASELGFDGVYERYLALYAGFADDASGYRAARARAGVQQASAMEEWQRAALALPKKKPRDEAGRVAHGDMVRVVMDTR